MIISHNAALFVYNNNINQNRQEVKIMSCTIKDIVKGNMDTRNERHIKQYLALIGRACLKSVRENPAAFRREVSRNAKVIRSNQKEDAKYRKLRAMLGF